jgi:hypothetical protein
MTVNEIRELVRSGSVSPIGSILDFIDTLENRVLALEARVREYDEWGDDYPDSWLEDDA